MAKDPAFLFYPGDWQGGTMYLTHEQKGCYIDLLILQFNVGKFTIQQAKQVLSICFTVAWPMLQQKFKTDGVFYWNERLEIEIDRRKNFTKSRRDNALHSKKQKNKGKAYAKHMENEDINEDENKNVLEKERRKKEFLTNQIWKNDFCMAKKIQMPALEKLQREFISDTDLKGEFVDSYKRYFTNWFNKKHNGTYQQPPTKPATGKSAGANELVASLKDDIASLGRPGS